ncbi:primosomal protein N', partial [Candidatus Bipolaricaulota bacterium]|nr:primosomal protein N' [Candidatus Bipolaricaulota bacterium]
LARQLHSYLQGRLERRVELYHSGLPEGERGRIWESARGGQTRLSQVHLSQACLIVGTRSALFLPLDDLGLLIVDEEQDRSYKQDEMIPHYHARTVAAAMSEARGEGAFLLFGSASPSLETFHAAERGAITLIRPPVSPKEREVRIVSMNKEKEPLSAELLAAIARTLKQGKRVLLAVNRRGSFQAVLCKKCGQPLRCPHCGGNLAYGVRSAQLVCRICGTAQSRMVCPHCGSRALRFVGVGSARVEGEVKERFPSARVVRIDMDTLRTREQERVAEQALKGEGEILVATPMVAKGPPLPRLGLVGAIGVDALLALPDFRAAERTYQYLTGLLGRLSPEQESLGQESLRGEAIVQTHYPDHVAILSAMDGDYDRFYAAEIAERKELFYPPFSHLARLILSTRGRGRQKDGEERLLSLLHQFEVEILGPAPHPIRRACQVLLLKGRTRGAVHEACAAAQQGFPRIEIDIDPERI